MAPKKAINGVKKRKTGGKQEEKQSVWLLTYVHTADYGGEEHDRKILAFSTKERAMAAMPKLMDDESPWGKDWRNGLRGFGRQKEDNYCGFEHFGDKLGEDGGVLLSNDNDHTHDTDGVTVSLGRVEVDPSDAGNETPAAVNSDYESSDDEDNVIAL